MNELWFPQGKWKRKLVSVSENGSGNLFLVSTGKMETETGFRFGKWKRKPVSVSEPDPFPHPPRVIHGENEKRKMETETCFRLRTRHPRESINESLSVVNSGQ